MLILLPTSIFPPISYMGLCASFEEIEIEIHEHYVKQDIRNRFYIDTAQGEQMLSIPVIKSKGNHTPTHLVGISYQMDWQRQHYKALCTSYRNAPFFEFYLDNFHAYFSGSYPYLHELNAWVLQTLCKVLSVNTKISYSETYRPHYTNGIDLRKESFTHYERLINFPEYFQVFENKHEFLPNLSILDAIFNLGPETGAYINSLTPLLIKHIHPKSAIPDENKKQF